MLVQNARRRQGTTGECDFDDSLVQTRASLLALALLLRCELVIMADFIRCRLSRDGFEKGDFKVDFTKNRVLCKKLIVEAANSSNCLQEAEGHILSIHARTNGLEHHL
jgi:hypothetical protein